jgi:phosphoglycolate phosphatase
MVEPRAGPIPGVRGIVFDLDGTLIDSYPAIATSVNAARRAFALDPLPEAEIRRHVGRGLEALMVDVLGPDRASAGAALFRERYAEVYPSGTSALPGALETVRELHSRGYRMAVASNKLSRFGRAILEQLGVGACFATVEGPDTAGTPKPEPAMLRRCLGAMAIAPEEAIYVGDMLLDVETAARARVRAVLVSGGSSDRADLLRTGAPVLSSLVELLDLLPPRAKDPAAGAGRS